MHNSTLTPSQQLTLFLCLWITIKTFNLEHTWLLILNTYEHTIVGSYNLYVTPFCFQRPSRTICSSLGVVPCIVRSNIGAKCRMLLPYPSPRVYRSVHEAHATSFSSSGQKVMPFFCPLTLCNHIFSPCWHSRINPKKGNVDNGVAVGSSVRETKISNQLLWNARPGAHLPNSSNWWTFGLGGPNCQIIRSDLPLPGTQYGGDALTTFVISI